MSSTSATTPTSTTTAVLELDHIFCFAPPLATEARNVLEETLGLVKTYERNHVGQGTANACYVFDNAFLELVWVTEEKEAQSPPIARTQLYQRSCFDTNQASPFGIAWRFATNDEQQQQQQDNNIVPSENPVETWPYCPPYLPPGMSIPVATVSDCLQMPFFFQTPGARAPKNWLPSSSSSSARLSSHDARALRQSKAGFTTLHIRRLATTGDGGAAELGGLKDILPPMEYDAPHHLLEIELQHKDGHVVLLSLPSFKVSYPSPPS